MDGITATICPLLEEKQERFAEYEALTSRMLSCSQEELERLSDQRTQLIQAIDQLDSQMLQAARAAGEPEELVEQAMRLRCARGDLPQRLQPIFDGSMQIRSIASRVQRLEPLIADRIEEELDGLLERIKENNRSVNAQAARFSAPEPMQPSLLSSHSRQA